MCRCSASIRSTPTRAGGLASASCSRPRASSRSCRIAVLRAGRIVAEGTPATLGGRDRAAYEISFTLPDGVGIDALPVAGAAALDGSGRVLIASDEVMETLHSLSGWAIQAGHEISD